MRSHGLRIWFGYSVVVVLIIVSCFAAWKAQEAGRTAERWVEHSLKVREKLEDLLRRYITIESNGLGYTLTGDEAFLETFPATRKSIESDTAELRHLTGDNARQQGSLTRLRELEVAQLGYLNRMVEAARAFGLDAGRVAAQTEPKSRLEDVRETIAEMRAEENRLLPERIANVRREDRAIWWIFCVLANLAVVFMTISNFRIRRMYLEASEGERKQASEHASLSEAQRLAKVGSWTWEIPEDRVQWSDELCLIFGQPRTKAGCAFAEQNHLYTVESTERLARSIDAAIAKSTSYSLELEGIRASGEKFPIWATGRAERDEEGKVVRLLGTVQDITEAHQMIERERELRKEALVALEAKGHFLAVMSHEVRTPINGILGFADRLTDQGLSPEQEECVRVIQESGRSLLCIVNDILDYSWMQSGKLKLVEGHFSLRALLEGVRELLAPGRGKPGVVFSIEVDEGLCDRFVGDSERLRQILNNLGSNALKFTEKGTVKVCVGERGARPGSEGFFLEFRVQDTGIGILPERIEEIFEPFAQSEESTSRKYGGAGLGLSIAGRLVVLMGGEITVNSRPGTGSEFLFSLPMRPVPVFDSEHETAVNEPLDREFSHRHPLSILVAEDDRTNSRVILYMLGKLGYKASHSWNGQETMDQCAQIRPACIFMDIHMPGVDGLGATRAIRADEKARGLPPTYIIALTADIMPEAREDCVEAGMSDYLSKPINLRELSGALQRCH